MSLKQQMKFYIDKDGYCSVDADEENRLVEWFLKDDIQGCLHTANEYIAACNSVENGQNPKWEGTGNAHTVTIKPDGVEIFNEYTEESLQIATIEEFKGYLERWKELLLSRE
ncbi:hypothetical protein [Photorhabdus aegyptia]|uniref:Uncharacterized protein n=1 Tax=Photorhabdus aegyptia TaxID=2805098 RepID=A0A022PAH7_9GAMM|nr:hypothetical protein [Photorhabdus aegyptia]EYU13187.1 hypothetical protein BA1DRAFT_04340 [Photorhabdus aegyptia]